MAQDIPIPQWVPRLVLPIGFALLFLRFGQVLYRLIDGKEAHLLGDEVEGRDPSRGSRTGRAAGGPRVTTVALFVLLFVFMLIGMPIAVALGLSSLLTILLFGNDSLASLSLKLFETSEHFTLLAIPFFILVGRVHDHRRRGAGA